MKARFVYEVFSETTDPIDDMGIGIRHMYDNLEDDDILIMINPMDMYYSSMKQTVIFPKGTIVHIHQIVNKEENRKQMVCTQYENTSDFINDIAIEEIDGSNKRNRSWGINYDFFKKYFRVIDRKSLNKSVNEKFEETGDPIQDMGIGGYTFETLKPGALLKLNPEYRNLVALTQNYSGQFTDRTGMQIRHNHCLLVTSIIPNKDGIKEIHFKRFFYDEGAREVKTEWEKTGRLGWGGSSNRMKVSKLQFDRRFNIIEKGFQIKPH